MNAKEWAERLNGREYREEMTAVEEKQAEADGMVIVFGASDDLIEFRGVIRDELGAWEGGVYKITSAKDVVCVTEHSANMHRALPDVRAVWSPSIGDDGPWTSWEITSTIPHETFDIMEDGEIYCHGIVFAWADAFPTRGTVADDSLYPVDRPVEPANRWENPEQWAYIADWEENRADRAEAARRNEEVNDFRMDELDAVMTSVDKWLKGEDLKNNPATRAADAREVALKAIEAETARADRAEKALKEAADRAVSFVDNNYNAFGEWDNIAFDNLRAAIMDLK